MGVAARGAISEEERPAETPTLGFGSRGLLNIKTSAVAKLVQHRRPPSVLREQSGGMETNSQIAFSP